MCPEVLAEVLKGLLIFRDALVSILLKNAIAMSQEEYPMQYDKVQCSTCLFARLDHAALFGIYLKAMLNELAPDCTTCVRA